MHLVGSERKAAQFVKHPRLAAGVATLFRRVQRIVERVHKVHPPEREGKERRGRLRKPNRIVEPTPPIQIIEQIEYGTHFYLERLWIKFLALREGTEELDRLLGDVRNARRVADDA